MKKYDQRWLLLFVTILATAVIAYAAEILHLKIGHTGTVVSVSWTNSAAVLEAAPSVPGQWIEIAGASNSFVAAATNPACSPTLAVPSTSPTSRSSSSSARAISSARRTGSCHGSTITAVKNLNLTVEGGHVYGLLGPNGAGKTTTLRLALGLTDADGGEITVTLISKDNAVRAGTLDACCNCRSPAVR